MVFDHFKNIHIVHVTGWQTISFLLRLFRILCLANTEVGADVIYFNGSAQRALSLRVTALPRSPERVIIAYSCLHHPSSARTVIQYSLLNLLS